MPFSVSLEKEVLIFSAAHFITFRDAHGKSICESLHGHNYRVQARIEGPLDEHSCVIDFIWLRDTLRRMTAELDHQVLLPKNHPAIAVESGEKEVVARFEDRRWVFPATDVALLPLDNTTAERLAEYLGLRLVTELGEQGRMPAEPWSLTVSVDENEGQWGCWKRPATDPGLQRS